MRWPNAVSDMGFPPQGGGYVGSDPSPFQVRAFHGDSRPARPQGARKLPGPDRVARLRRFLLAGRGDEARCSGRWEENGATRGPIQNRVTWRGRNFVTSFRYISLH